MLRCARNVGTDHDTWAWVGRVRRWPWRDAVPSRWAWLRLWASPSSYILLAALALTIVAKASSLAGLRDAGWWPALTLWAITADVVLHAGLAALFALGEARVPRLIAVTIPLALLVAAVSLINAAYLSVTGEQLTYEAVRLGLDRWTDLMAILGDKVDHLGWGRLVGLAAFLGAVPLAVRWLLGRATGPWQPVTYARQRGLAAALATLVALVVWLVAPAPSSLPAQQLGHSAVVRTYWGWATQEDPTAHLAEPIEFAGYAHPQLVSDDEIGRFVVAGRRPNVLVLVLESTRYDHTSLAGEDGPAETPNLAALALRGATAPVTRTVLPHTSKALVAMLCARYPLMQQENVEVSAYLEIQCLPDVLARAGYRTAFFQSSLGSFEQRPRLADKLGFAHFEAWEEIGGEPLGYLASDDESLAPPFARWLDAGDDQPFFATILTSAPHHPYRLSAAAQRRVEQSGKPAGSAAERYARLVEAQDHLLGALLAVLDERALRGDTLVVVAGDHGEGFGDKGVRQHDANFYEEGLRVPLVLAGPGVPRAEVPGNVTLVDLTPTLLRLLGLRPAAPEVLAGHDIFAGVPDEPRWFGCWYAFRCRGFVLGDRKVVFIPQTRAAFYFDLAEDPDESRPLPLTEDLAALLPELHRAIDSHRTRRFPLVYGPIRPYGDWRCEAHAPCAHPRSPADHFFEPP
jgi:lipoteichoic acid synthase